MPYRCAWGCLRDGPAAQGHLHLPDGQAPISAITADILFILILVELFRLLIIYLLEQQVSIGVSVEIAILSVLREVIVNGVLATVALLLVVRAWLPPTFEGVDPEAQVSARLRGENN